MDAAVPLKDSKKISPKSPDMSLDDDVKRICGNFVKYVDPELRIRVMMESDGGLNLSIFHSRPTSQLTVERLVHLAHMDTIQIQYRIKYKYKQRINYKYRYKLRIKSFHLALPPNISIN